MSTQTMTTTTLRPLQMYINSPILVPCSPLILEVPLAAVPQVVHDTLWQCEPAEAPICQALIANLQFAEAPGNALTISDTIVAAAAHATASLPCRWAGCAAANGNIHLTANPRDVTGMLLGFAVLNFHFDVSGAITLSAKEGRTEFNELEDFVRLSVRATTCGTTVASELMIFWSWREYTDSSEYQNVQAGSNPTNMAMPISSLNGPGSYSFRAESPNVRPVYFNVTIENAPPPTVQLDAPVQASSRCSLTLDASSSTDPKGEALTYAWRCAAANADTNAWSAWMCNEEANRTTTSSLIIAGATLLTGDYVFTVIVSRSDASSSMSQAVTLDAAQAPVVSIRSPPDEVSPQQDLSVIATAGQDESCAAPVWKTWWLLWQSNDTVATRLQVSNTQVDLFIAAPLPAPPGHYRLRLVLSDRRENKWEGHDVFTYDSRIFEIDAPPASGECQVYPPSGNVASTHFTLSSVGWIDDDLPLMHRFTWTPDPRLGVWRSLSSFQYESTFQNAIFSSLGNVTVRVEARDQLGSVSMATALVVLTYAPASSEQLRSIVDDISATGDHFATIAAIAAVAEHGGGGGDVSFTNHLISTAANSIGGAEATPESIASTAQALGSVLDMATGNSVKDNRENRGANRTSSPSVDISTAHAAMDLISSVASSASTLASGLQVEQASALVGHVNTLLVSTDTTGGTSAAGTGTNATDAAAQMAVGQDFSQRLQSATDSIGDAVLSQAAVGHEVSVQSAGGLTMQLRKEDPDVLERSGATVGNFVLPPGIGLNSRRLSGTTCGASGISLHNINWPSSPHAWAGDASSATQEEIDESLGGGVLQSCCEVPDDKVQTMNVRVCGNTIEVNNLSQPLNFEVFVPLRNITDEFRLCQYFDEDLGAWTGEGCKVDAIFDDRVRCACTHLSSFTAVYGMLGQAFRDFFCPNADVLSSSGMRAILKGVWWRQHPAIIMWGVVVVIAIFAAFAWRRERKREEELGQQIIVAHPKNQAQDGDERIRGLYSRFFSILGSVMIGSEIDVSELSRQPMYEAWLTLFTIAFLQISVPASEGVSSLDLTMVGSHDIAKVRRGATKISQGKLKRMKTAEMDSQKVPLTITRILDVLNRTRQQGNVTQRQHLQGAWNSFRALHPLIALLSQSLVYPWFLQTAMVADALFGSLALNALFLSNGARSNAENTTCPNLSIWANFGRDLGVSIVTMLLTIFPVTIMMQIHQKKVDFIQDAVMMQRAVVKRHIRAAIALAVGMVYWAACLIYIMAFLANVSLHDANEWLLTLVCRLMLAWLILPMLGAGFWCVVWSLAARRPSTLTSATKALEQLLPTKERVHSGGQTEQEFWDYVRAGGGGGLGPGAAANVIEPPPVPPLTHEPGPGIQRVATPPQIPGLAPDEDLGSEHVAEVEDLFWGWVNTLQIHASFNSPPPTQALRPPPLNILSRNDPWDVPYYESSNVPEYEDESYFFDSFGIAADPASVDERFWSWAQDVAPNANPALLDPVIVGGDILSTDVPPPPDEPHPDELPLAMLMPPSPPSNPPPPPPQRRPITENSFAPQWYPPPGYEYGNVYVETAVMQGEYLGIRGQTPPLGSRALGG